MSSSQTSNGGASKSPSSSRNQRPKASKSEWTFDCENAGCPKSKLWSLLHVYDSQNLGFTRKDNLLRHMKIYHQGMISRCYWLDILLYWLWSADWTCPICGKEFGRGDNGPQHVRQGHDVHGYVCPKCNHNFERGLIPHFEDAQSDCIKAIREACNNYTGNRERFKVR
jgi:hypothetical protein